MSPGDVRTFKHGEGNALVVGLGMWAKRQGKWIHIHLTGPDDSQTTVTNNPESVRYHRTLFRNLRRTLVKQSCWPFGEEGSETEQPDGKSVAVTDLQGAVVLHEYRIAGRGARVFSTHDVTGQQTVFAPDAIRAQVAELAGLTLADQGALITLISVEMAAGAECSPPLPTAPGSQSLIATRTRTLPKTRRAT